MRTQADIPARIVSVDNLSAMCSHASGVSHRFWVEKVSRSRVLVGYSNPNEYGSESPMFLVLPCFPNGFDGEQDNPFVVLHSLRVINDTWDGEGWQAFGPMLDQYASREPDGAWRVVPFNTVQLFGRDYVRAQHKAYGEHGACHICQDIA